MFLITKAERLFTSGFLLNIHHHPAFPSVHLWCGQRACAVGGCEVTHSWRVFRYGGMVHVTSVWMLPSGVVCQRMEYGALARSCDAGDLGEREISFLLKKED